MNVYNEEEEKTYICTQQQTRKDSKEMDKSFEWPLIRTYMCIVHRTF